MAVTTPTENARLPQQEIERILTTPVLAQIDAERFPHRRSLRQIIAEEARIIRFDKGDIVVRDGDYGSSVFVILKGAVRVVLDAETSRRISGRRPARRATLVSTFAQAFTSHKVAEQRDAQRLLSSRETSVRWNQDQPRTYVRKIDELLRETRGARLEVGALFGEVAALTRSPRTATIVAETAVELAEIRWQGLRELRLRDPGFRATLDRLYQSRDLSNHLRESPLFANLDDATLAAITQHAVLESYGELEWSHDFQRQKQDGSAAVVGIEPLIAEEDHYVDGLLILRSGFARITRRIDHGHRTIGYLTANECFGLDAIINHHRGDDDLRSQYSLRAIGYVDILRIPTRIVVDHLLPHLDQLSSSQLKDGTPSSPLASGGLDQSMLDALVDHRVINGQSAMIINSDRCIDCDDCVAACSTTHGGNPRFVRQGPGHAELMFSSACMHCNDPVCLIGCPTGAIHRQPDDLRVLINDLTCIGCSTCADACPYDNIRMVEVRDSTGALIVDPDTGESLVKATKCDLCVSQVGGPACQNACPHDALIRIDPRDRQGLGRWRSGANHRWRRWRNASIMVAATTAGLGLDHIWDHSLHRQELASGWTLICAVAILCLLALRKRLPGLPLGTGAAWTSAHTWTGLFSLAIFGAHAGWMPPLGRLESALWLLFIAVAASGVAGAAAARILPSRLGRYGERMLPGRFEALARQLRDQAEELARRSVRETASATIAEFYARRLAPFFARPRYRLAHLVESQAPIERLRAELRHLERYLDAAGKQLLAELDDCILAKANLDHQRAIQSALHGWRYIHVPVTVLLLGGVLLHAALALTGAQ